MKRNKRKPEKKRRIATTPHVSAGKKATAKKVSRTYSYASLAARF